jgi:hypothetical protein
MKMNELNDDYYHHYSNPAKKENKSLTKFVCWYYSNCYSQAEGQHIDNINNSSMSLKEMRRRRRRRVEISIC